MRLALIATIVALGSSPAAASIKLCLRPKTPPQHAVPVDPSFVVETDNLGTFRVTTSTGATPKLTITRVHEFWSRITVAAPAGTTLIVPGRCNFPVHLNTGAWQRHDEPPRITIGGFVGGAVMLDVAWAVADQQHLRVDWASSARDLGTPRQGTRVELSSVESPVTHAFLPTGPDLELVYVRFTPILLDGTEGKRWDGWVHHDRTTGALRLGQGQPPVPDPQPTCPALAPWVSGENPTFTYRGIRRTFRAIASNGRSLPVTLAAEYSFSYPRVTVAARAGTRFKLEVLPVGASCPLDVHVVAGKRAPRVVVNTLGATAQQVTFHVREPVEPRVAVEYGNTSWHGDVILPVVAGAITLPVEKLDWEFMDGVVRGVMRVRVAPERHGFEGRACEIWLSRDTGTSVGNPLALEHERCEAALASSP